MKSCRLQKSIRLGAAFAGLLGVCGLAAADPPFITGAADPN
jgi:hypothetical protein